MSRPECNMGEYKSWGQAPEPNSLLCESHSPALERLLQQVGNSCLDHVAPVWRALRSTRCSDCAAPVSFLCLKGLAWKGQEEWVGMARATGLVSAECRQPWCSFFSPAAFWPVPRIPLWPPFWGHTRPHVPHGQAEP